MAFSIFYWANYTQGQGKRSYPGCQKMPWRMTGFWSFCMMPTYVMLNPQCNVTGNTRMVA